MHGKTQDGELDTVHGKHCNMTCRSRSSKSRIGTIINNRNSQKVKVHDTIYDTFMHETLSGTLRFKHFLFLCTVPTMYYISMQPTEFDYRKQLFYTVNK